MLDLTLVATHNGQEYPVTPTAGAVIVLERKYGKPAAVLFAEPSMEHLAFLAWEQIRRNVAKNGEPAPQPFDKWLENLDNIETDTSDDGDSPKG